jgi:hypothetical protein
MRKAILLLALPVLCAAATPPQHPRLFLTPETITRLRTEINGSRKQHWDSLRRVADQQARSKPPVYDVAIRKNDPEQLWQRNVGNAMPTLAIAYLLTGDAKYKTAAQDWALASCSYPTWGGPKYDGGDLAAGHQLFGLAMVYDWLYNDLDPQVRQTIHDTLLTRGRVMFKATDPKTGPLLARLVAAESHVGQSDRAHCGGTGDRGRAGDRDLDRSRARQVPPHGRCARS